MKKVLLVILVVTALIAAWIFWRRASHLDDLKSLSELKKDYPEFTLQGAGTVLMIFAHSDDELGTIALAARLKKNNPALKFKWIIVSDGGRGFVFPGACGELSKKECRIKEARSVADCADLPHPTSLNLPDGSVKETPQLSEYLLTKIPELTSPDLRAIMTHDNRGLYGHDDHVAVYDAVMAAMKGRSVQIVSMALPEFFLGQMKILAAAKKRSPMPITHAYKLSTEDIELKKCAAQSHQSQKLIIEGLLFKGLGASEFFHAAPREFLTVQTISER